MRKILCHHFILLFLYAGFFVPMNTYAEEKPNEFVYLKSWAPTIQEEVRYYTANNFIGRPIQGYLNPVCLLTKKAANALLSIQNTLSEKNLGLRVFDCYRPQMAVDDFFQWSQNPQDQKMKNAYYPHINKADLFTLNYIARRSGHTRGSTVDLTLVDLKTNEPLDMGTPFDFMDPLSHPSCRKITIKQFHNRMLLRRIMMTFGFSPLKTEWWHFTLKDEPYKNTYFNFPLA
ncbi:MAG: M15 family metallopeptidase [Pseudomonadota bacterium]